MRDTAFYNLVTGVTTDHAALKTELLWMATQSFTNWAASTPWCFNIIYDSAPAQGVATVLNRLLLTYDYMGRAAFSSGELGHTGSLVFDAADYWRRDMDFSQDDKFVNRWAGNYTRTNPCDGDIDVYVGGPTVQSYAKYNNNRRGAMLRFATMVGVYLTSHGRNYTDGRYGTQANLITSGKMFVQEHIRFSTFPQGVVGEFDRRGAGGNIEQGWGYAGAVLGEVMAMADVLARSGDTSLYTYNTAAGECNSAGTINDGGSRVGQNKDVLFTLQLFMKYPTDQYTRYWPDTSTINNRLDGRVPRDGSTWHGVHETNLVMANTYFQDTFVKQAYTRTHVNSVPYPTNPIAGPPPWEGENALWPGVLFMFGNLEGTVGLGQTVDPYNLTATSAPPTVTITAPTSSPTYTTGTTPLTTIAGGATDDVGVPAGGITWTCPTCTPTSNPATCATCGATATSVSWSIASLGLASGDNVLTVTVTDAEAQAVQDVLTMTLTTSPVPRP